MTIISSPKAVRPWQSRLLLFQSWGQFISYLLSVGLVLLAAAWAIHVAGERLSLEPIVGGFLGALAAVQLTETYAFGVEGDSMRTVRQAIDARLERAGFIEEGHGAIIHYRHKAPRWVTFKENDVYLNQGDGLLLVSGPRYLIKNLHKAAVAVSPGI